MPPKTKMTPEEVAAQPVKDGVKRETPIFRKNKNPGSCRDITLSTTKEDITHPWAAK